MTDYQANFRILGDVMEMLFCEEPSQRLLIDISAKPDSDGSIPEFVYRTSFSVTDPELISNLQDQVSLGDVIEATGSFWQTGYEPNRAGFVDTTFRLSEFRLIRKQAVYPARFNPYQGLFRYLNVH